MIKNYGALAKKEAEKNYNTMIKSHEENDLYGIGGIISGFDGTVNYDLVNYIKEKNKYVAYGFHPYIFYIYYDGSWNYVLKINGKIKSYFTSKTVEDLKCKVKKIQEKPVEFNGTRRNGIDDFSR